MSSPAPAGSAPPSTTARWPGVAGSGLVLVFLAANALLHAQALQPAAVGIWAFIGLALAVGIIAARPALLPRALQLFGATFLLFGFHSYRPHSQVFALALSGFGIALALRLARGATGADPAGRRLFRLFGPFAALAALSLLLLPARVLEHRLYLEGGGIGRAVLNAFPKDPLYPIASVDRLLLFVVVSGLLAAQPDGRALCRSLFRGVAWAALASALLGLLDFAGWLPLSGYNLSHVFYGEHYRRLQSTFGNPSWFACFAACALPLVLLLFHEARGGLRVALSAALPLYAASLFLSGARAAWLAVTLILVSLAAIAVRTHGRRVWHALDGPSRLALCATLALLALLARPALTTGDGRVGSDRAPGRLEGLSRELQYRGIGLNSPRRVASAYAAELAKLAPLFGLGYESFNMHLRAQLDIAASGVAQVVNVAVAADPSETLFDDSHNTYLQVLTGTGALGLSLWLALAGGSLFVAARALRCGAGTEALAVLLALGCFHFYGLLQGMAYIPVTFFLLPALTAYALVLDRAPRPLPGRWAVIPPLLGILLVVAGVVYARDNGYAGLKRRFGVAAYLPDEAAEFEGFYRPEASAGGEFRWMADRAIVNLRSGRPFRLSFTCEHADAERDPVVLSLRFEGRDAGRIVFRRPGVVEQRFELGTPGTLRLRVSRTFEPGGGDRRRLGIAVSAIRWE
jgi:hypothetical protein